jgi:tetratricopeptide (TPR) repeat protein
LGFYMRRSFESSIESYKKAVAIEPGWAAAWHWLGAVLDEIGRTEEAIGCFDRMLALNPDDEGAKWLKTDCQAKLGSSPSRV